MRTKTLVWAAAGIAVAVLGGAVIWAATDDDSRRQAVLERPSQTAHKITMPGVNGGLPFGLNSYSVGGKLPLSQGQVAGKVQWDPLQFSRPLDEISRDFLDQAAGGASQQSVVLEIVGGTKSQPVLRYQFSPALFKSGDEAASGGEKPIQSIEVAYEAPQIQLLTAGGLGYAPATGAAGKLNIPNVTDNLKPAYVSSYAWGWDVPISADPAGGLASGRLQIKSLTIERQLDSHAPWFWQRLAQGQVSPQMTFQVEGVDPSTGKPTTYALYTLTNVVVHDVHDSGGQELREQVQLTFSKIEVKYGAASPVAHDTQQLEK